MTGLVGFLFILAILLTIDIHEALNGSTGNAVVDTVIYCAGEKYGALVAWLLVINIFFAGVSSCTVTGRITYALMRDKAFPFSNFWAQVDPNTKSPIRYEIY